MPGALSVSCEGVLECVGRDVGALRGGADQTDDGGGHEEEVEREVLGGVVEVDGTRDFGSEHALQLGVDCVVEEGVLERVRQK